MEETDPDGTIDLNIFLGDLIDRGPDSIAAVQRVVNLIEEGKARLILGNHEVMFMGAMQGDSTLLSNWLFNGGDDVLKQRIQKRLDGHWQECHRR